jgi:uncharacterized protein (DUF488 family)
MARLPRPQLVLTIGHSTHPLEEFIALLKAHGIKRLIDVRTIPRSHHNPQFNAETLPAKLCAAGISYMHLKKLGGLRHARVDSPNIGWRNASFRGYADYMQTAEFRKALERLIRLASGKPSAIMCAEAVPWRCHRSLIADALEVKRIPVAHIMSATRAQPHGLTPFIRVSRGRITYPETKAQTQLNFEALADKAPRKRKASRTHSAR